MESVYAVAPGLVVMVLEPDPEGRPEGYTGGIGTFRVWATARPDTLRVGDPLTVTLYVEGPAGLEDVGPVALGKQADITRHFRVYEDQPTGEIKQGRKIFVYSVRPLSAEITALPPIAFSYFDVAKEAYRTVRTEPVPLTVTRAEVLDPSEVVVSKSSSGTTDLSERAEGIFANLTDPAGLANERVRAARLGCDGGGAAGHVRGPGPGRGAGAAPVRRSGGGAAAKRISRGSPGAACGRPGTRCGPTVDRRARGVHRGGGFAPERAARGADRPGCGETGPGSGGRGTGRPAGGAPGRVRGRAVRRHLG